MAAAAVAAGVLAGIPVAPERPSGGTSLGAPSPAIAAAAAATVPGPAPAGAAAAPLPGGTPAEAPIAPPAAFDAAPEPAAPPPSVLTAAAAPRGGVWAVVIGIDDYPGGSSDLRASVHDADTVEWTLASYGVPADRRLVLRNTQATASVIGDAMRWLVTNAGPDATAVLFYAGHVRSLGRGTQAIVAADGELVTDRAVADALRPLRARAAWIVMASCYGGGFDEVLAPNRILTAAAPAGSLAYENARYANSYLVEYLFQRAMMEGAAPDSVERAFAWADAALRRDHPDRAPVQLDRLDGELRLGRPPVRAPVSPPAPPAPPAPPVPPPVTTTTTLPPEEDGDGCLLFGLLGSCD